jgi:hypothetical protein
MCLPRPPTQVKKQGSRVCPPAHPRELSLFPLALWLPFLCRLRRFVLSLCCRPLTAAYGAPLSHSVELRHGLAGPPIGVSKVVRADNVAFCCSAGPSWPVCYAPQQNRRYPPAL